MITKDEILEYIDKIPPTSNILKECIALLNAGELTKAAKVAQEDRILSTYLKNVVNRPIYGFKNEVSDISQIFSIFGVGMSQQVVYNYMISLLSPNKWELFGLDKKSFYDLQANLSKKWELVLKHLGIKDKDFLLAITLLPSAIIVIEALFKTKKAEVILLKNSNSLDYNTILVRLTSLNLFDVCLLIAKKWGMSMESINVVDSSLNAKILNDKQVTMLGRWMHLLLFYELSTPKLIEAGLNDFLDFNVEFVSSVYDDFSKVMELN